MSNIVLSEIIIYPIKSLAGINLAFWPIIETGFKYDRQWMLIDEEGIFLSQRRLPRMALIKTALTDYNLVLSATGMTDLVLGFEPESDKSVNVSIWHDRVDAVVVSGEANAWFSRFLQTPCRLVYQPSSSIRAVNPDYAKPEDRTALSDGFPFLLISENSLVELNEAMGLTLPMARFRPNLVVSGCNSYTEDSWRNIKIGNIGFRLPKPCSRCSVPTIDPNTAEIGKEPLTTLNRLRKWQNKVYFGQNAIHDGVGMLSVGDEVVVIETGVRQPLL